MKIQANFSIESRDEAYLVLQPKPIKDFEPVTVHLDGCTIEEVCGNDEDKTFSLFSKDGNATLLIKNTTDLEFEEVKAPKGFELIDWCMQLTVVLKDEAAYVEFMAELNS